MLSACQILVSGPARRLVLAAGVVTLLACGQKGPLYLPTGEAAAGRASLPETMVPAAVAPAAHPASAPPNTGTASPVRIP
jgi:predicted small lipoprotein YifL